MANELVRIAQACRIEHTVVGETDGVVEGSAERITGAPQFGDIAHEAEGAGTGEIAVENLGGQHCRVALAADQRVGEVDLDLETEAGVIWQKLAERAALGDANRLQNLDVTARRILALEPGRLDRFDESDRAAVKIGTSPPSTSTMALSTPRPVNAASRCSTVEHMRPCESPRTVAKSVLQMAAGETGIWRMAPSAPRLTKTIPVSGPAGRRETRACAPEWTARPIRATGSEGG